MQKQVAKTTHALCFLLDSTRKLTHRIRIEILKQAEDELKSHTRKANAIKGMSQREKSRPLERIFKDLENA